MPGNATTAARYACYRTDANVLGARRGSLPADEPSACSSAHPLPPNRVGAAASPQRSIPVAEDRPLEAPLD
eukprot:3041275-Pleurochrysis_carterae.AAC.1